MIYLRQECETHVNAPELLHRIESDNFLKQIVPVIALQMIVSQVDLTTPSESAAYLPTRWLSEPKRPLVHQRMFDIKIIVIVKDGNCLIARFGRSIGIFA